MWKAADKRRDPSNVIAALGSYEIDQQVDIMPKDGLNLHSSSGAFNEEGAISESKMANSFELFGLQGIHAHCSGHASGRDLIEIVNAINTKKLLLVDTEHPSSSGSSTGQRLLCRVPPPRLRPDRRLLPFRGRAEIEFGGHASNFV